MRLLLPSMLVMFVAACDSASSTDPAPDEGPTVVSGSTLGEFPPITSPTTALVGDTAILVNFDIMADLDGGGSQIAIAFVTVGYRDTEPGTSVDRWYFKLWPLPLKTDGGDPIPCRLSGGSPVVSFRDADGFTGGFIINTEWSGLAYPNTHTRNWWSSTMSGSSGARTLTGLSLSMSFECTIP